MPHFIVVNSEYDLEVDYLAEFQQNKRVKQNLFYTTEGAQSFYTYRGSDIAQIKWQDEYVFFARQPFWQPDKAMAFISLGCGNAAPEQMLLHHAHAQGYDLAYVGVDSSHAMLHLAQATLSQEHFTRHFIQADFSTEAFRQVLCDVTGHVDTRIVAMLGGTLGNFDQRMIADILQNIAQSGDYVYLDIVPRYASDAQDQQLRRRLAQLPQNLSMFFSQLLEKLCIPEDAGEVYGEETKDVAVDAWHYAFFFKATRTLTFPCFGGEMTLAPGEAIELLNIRAYNPVALKAFLATYGFVFVDEYVPNVGDLSHLWQRFLFERA